MNTAAMLFYYACCQKQHVLEQYMKAEERGYIQNPLTVQLQK